MGNIHIYFLVITYMSYIEIFRLRQIFLGHAHKYLTCAGIARRSHLHYSLRHRRRKLSQNIKHETTTE